LSIGFWALKKMTKVNIGFLFFVYKLCFLLGNTESVDPPRKISLFRINSFFYYEGFFIFYL